MDISIVETAIISRLKSKITDVLIQGFPEKPSEFRLLHPIGALLVHYQGASYSEPKSIGCIVQDSKLEFSITVVMKNLRPIEKGAYTGAYAYIDKVKQVLTGYKIDGCTKMYPLKEEFLGEDNGIWQYGINFALTSQNIEVAEDEELPLLKTITTNSEY